MSRLNTLCEHGRLVRNFGSHGRGYVPNDVYERGILPYCDDWGIDQTSIIRAMIQLIIDEGLNQCLD